MIRDRTTLAAEEALSVTRTVKLDEPVVVGVPEIVLPASVKPAGRVPLAIENVYGGDPPFAFSDCEYGTSTVPGAKEEVLMVKAGALIVSDNAAVADTEALSVTLRVKLDDPAAEGVPEIVLPERLKPAGRAPVAMEKVNGGVPPVAFTCCE